MSRILLLADAGTHSGFATVTESIFGRLVTDYGHDVHVLAANYRGDYWDSPLKLYVANRDEDRDIIGMSRIVRMLGDLMPDVVCFIQDPKVVLNALLANPWDRENVLWRGMKLEGTRFSYKPPILAYLAIDGYENPRMWDKLAERVTRIAMSEHGRAAMPEAPVIWHGVDTTVFHPRDKREAKAALGLDPDRFLVLRVDKNSWRKDYPSSWKALAPVLRRHPDIDVHFHCRDNAADGYDLTAVRWNDEDVRDRVTFTADLGGYLGWPQERLALLYASADMFLSTSWGEGFSLTNLESLACGTPVLAQDCSALTEVVGPGGILVKPAGRITVPMGQQQCLPDIDKFTYWIERLYESPKVRAGLAAAGIAHAAQFSWDIAAQKFDKLIREQVEANRPE